MNCDELMNMFESGDPSAFAEYSRKFSGNTGVVYQDGKFYDFSKYFPTFLVKVGKSTAWIEWHAPDESYIIKSELGEVTRIVRIDEPEVKVK